MENFIMPKHSGEITLIKDVLEFYNSKNDWVSNNDLKKHCKETLKRTGDDSSHTKLVQWPAYFRFIEWKDPHLGTSLKKITESGKTFLKAIEDNDIEQMNSLLLKSMENFTFGRNAHGVSSDSDYEAPNIAVRCALALDYFTKAEYQFILDQLVTNGKPIFDLISFVKKQRLTKDTNYPDIKNTYVKDPKILQVLNGCEFFKLDKKEYTLNDNLLKEYADRLLALKITNSEVSQPSGSEDEEENVILTQNTIYYGSPGTGKSHKADEITNGKDVQKVTFHPDYDYHSLVGSYKPTMDGDKIAYKFVPQIFTKIYIDAWKNLTAGGENKPFYLQIEEINRGNCAEIFGDLFQLLDRDKDGFSKYEVTAEEELYKYLLSADGFGGDHDGIKGGKLRFPSNLKIIATMNTSDQSLFPMDSAFKRRWDWIYVPIDYNCSFSDFTIQLDNGKAFKWLEFLKSVNKEIFDIDKNQDKQIGNWFIDAQNSGKIISESTFVNKVVFYLWNDVFKDEEKTIFKAADGNNLTYTSFFENDTSNNLVSYILAERLQLTNIGKAEPTTTDEE